MALTTATITGDIADQLGNDFDNRRTKIWLTTNVPGQTIVDSAGDKIRLGSGNVTLASDGTFSAVVWVPGTGSNPASWQTTIHVDYPDRNTTTGRAVKSFGPFTITTSANLSDLVAEMPVQPEYLATVLETVQEMIDDATGGTGPALTALADRLDGVNDHGNVSGTLTLDPANGFHVFDATGPLEISLGDPPGYSVAFKAITGADDVTIDGLDDLELTDDAWATFVHYRSSWHLAASGASGGGDVEPVTDPPTQPGTVTVDPTADGYNLSWVASTVAAGYEVQIDGGAWVDSGANLTHAFTGLAAGSSHSGSVRAYNTLGAKSTGRAWGPSSTDTVGLHEQILALEPTYYLRASQGSLESLGSEGGWAYQGPGSTYDGPPLAPGATGSVLVGNMSVGGYLVNSNATILNGATSITVVALVRPVAGMSKLFNAYPLAEFGASAADSGSYSNEYTKNGSTHLFAATKGTGATQSQWRDGVAVNTDTQAFASGASPQDGDAYIGGWFAGGGGNFYLSHIAIFVNQVLSADTLMALAVAADTDGNPV